MANGRRLITLLEYGAHILQLLYLFFCPEELDSHSALLVVLILFSETPFKFIVLFQSISLVLFQHLYAILYNQFRTLCRYPSCLPPSHVHYIFSSSDIPFFTGSTQAQENFANHTLISADSAKANQMYPLHNEHYLQYALYAKVRKMSNLNSRLCNMDNANLNMLANFGPPV